MTKSQLIYSTNQTTFTDLSLDPIWCSWFSGFSAGEGCFSVNIRLNKGRSYNPTFSIGLRSDDLGVLKEIRETLCCGGTYPHTRGDSPRSYVFAVHRRYEIVNILVPLFDAFPLRNKKQVEYEIWRKVALAVNDEIHLTDREAEVRVLCEQLREVRKYREFTRG